MTPAHRPPQPGRRRVPLLARRFSVRRAGQLVTYAALAVALLAVTTLPAYADPKGGGLGALQVFDVADSRGIRVSQYELSIDTGGVTAFHRIWPAQRLLAGWDIYRYSVGIAAYLVDWTINMSWLSVVTDPLQRVEEQIRTQLLTPINLVGFMLLLSAAVGGIHILAGRHGKGLWDIISAALVAAAVAGFLAAPVAAGTGDPLTKARHIGVGIADMITSDGALTSADIDSAAPDRHVDVGSTLVDTMIRPAHGLLNYGVDVTAGHPCAGPYDEALKAGPLFDPTENTAREQMADCDPALGEYAETTIFSGGAALSLFIITALLICGLILLVCALLFIAVLMLGWNLLKLMVTAVIGVGPGDVRGPMIRNAAQVVVSLVYVATSMIVLAVVALLIRTAFSAPVQPILRFIVVDLVVVGGMVIVVQTWAAHRKGAQSWAEKLMSRMKQSVPKPTVGSRVGSWLKGPVGGQASVYGDLNGGGLGRPGGRGGGATGSPYGVSAMLRPVTSSNAFQLARLGGMAAVTVGSAGTAVAAGGAAAAARGTVAAARGGAAAARGAAHGVRFAGTVARAYTATRAGTPTSTGNATADDLVERGVRAREWLHDTSERAQTSARAGTAAAGLVVSNAVGLGGGTLRQDPQTRPTAAAAEDPTHQRARITAERQLRLDRLGHSSTPAGRSDLNPVPPDSSRPTAQHPATPDTPAGTPGAVGTLPDRRPSSSMAGGPPVIVQTTTAADRLLQRLNPTPLTPPDGPPAPADPPPAEPDPPAGRPGSRAARWLQRRLSRRRPPTEPMRR